MQNRTASNERRITFDEMPSLINEMLQSIDSVKKKVDIIEQKMKTPPVWMSIDDLIKYIPSPPTKRTIYDWIRYNKIPYHKREDRTIHFRLEEIDEWLKSNPYTTGEIVKSEAEEYIKSHPKSK